MCCLFGILDYKNVLTAKQKCRLITSLAVAAEARGTDATGIAYNSDGRLCIYKRPLPAHLLRFRIPADARAVMGHTRMTTQGDERKNRNNHPFSGHTEGQAFALAHNGVLYNDITLRRSLGLPQTKIETDSYVAVQLIEQKKSLDFHSLQCMAEKVEGSFSFTVLDSSDNLYVVKGDSPFCLYHYPDYGLYLYASTEEILKKALASTWLSGKLASKVILESGDIVCIDKAGAISKSSFNDSGLYACYAAPWALRPYASWGEPPALGKQAELSYIDEIKSVASAFGYTPESIDRLFELGFSPEELEEYLYCGEL